MTDTTSPFAQMPEDARTLDRWLLADGRLDLLRERLTLSDIVGSNVALRPAGQDERRGPCPAPDHEDDGETFFVNDLQGIFHCFGCGIHGDAIRWMTDYRGMSYVEAVRHLSREAGLMPSAESATKAD